MWDVDQVVRTLGPSAWAVFTLRFVLIWFYILFYLARRPTCLRDQLSCLHHYSTKWSRASILWVWLISWEFIVGNHINRSWLLWPQVLPVRAWGLHGGLFSGKVFSILRFKGKATEIPSMSDFYPGIFSVLVNLLSNLADFKSAKTII